MVNHVNNDKGLLVLGGPSALPTSFCCPTRAPLKSVTGPSVERCPHVSKHHHVEQRQRLSNTHNQSNEYILHLIIIMHIQIVLWIIVDHNGNVSIADPCRLVQDLAKNG